MSVVVRKDQIPLNESYEPGLRIDLGIVESTAGSKNILLGHTVFPPGNKNQWHYHGNCEAAQYIIRGKLRCKWLDDGKVQSQVLEPGDFIYILRGEPHTQENASDTEEVELVFTYSGANSVESAGTVFITPPEGEAAGPNAPKH